MDDEVFRQKRVQTGFENMLKEVYNMLEKIEERLTTLETPPAPPAETTPPPTQPPTDPTQPPPYDPTQPPPSDPTQPA